jgi:hypothetical protein
MVHHLFFLAKAGFDLGNQRRIGAGKASAATPPGGNAFQHLAMLGIHLGEQGRDAWRCKPASMVGVGSAVWGMTSLQQQVRPVAGRGGGVRVAGNGAVPC